MKVRIRKLDDGFITELPIDEWLRYGEPERAAWEVLNPEVLIKAAPSKSAFKDEDVDNG